MLKNTTLKKQQQMPRVAIAFHDKYYPTLAMLTIAVIFLCVSGDAFADDTSTALAPILTKILGSLSGTFGKIVMAICLAFSAMAGLAGMSKAVVFTPAGVGLLLVNAEVIVNWLFG